MNSPKSFDVVVAGGGFAGISAALAAARGGARTCLLEKEYALGGLATLGLIVIYLPLCDGRGVQMSGGIAEELLKLSQAYNTERIPEVWAAPASVAARAQGQRYMMTINPASFMIMAERLLREAGVTIYYDVRLSDVQRENGGLSAVYVETKRGRQAFEARAFVDATGDADLCFFAGEATYDNPENRRTGWFFSYDGREYVRHAQTDPLFEEIPATSRLYSGTDIDDIAAHMFDMHDMIMEKTDELRRDNPDLVPLVIPSFHGLRMTRRLDAGFRFDMERDEGVWYPDAIGMIGNWRQRGPRYSIPLRALQAVENNNLYVAGRCMCADIYGWDLLRVIPSCAVTGEAAGVAAAMQARGGLAPEAKWVQAELLARGALLDETLFDRTASE